MKKRIIAGFLAVLMIFPCGTVNAHAEDTAPTQTVVTESTPVEEAQPEATQPTAPEGEVVETKPAGSSGNEEIPFYEKYSPATIDENGDLHIEITEEQKETAKNILEIIVDFIVEALAMLVEAIVDIFNEWNNKATTEGTTAS
jgi:hypothetical protein